MTPALRFIAVLLAMGIFSSGQGADILSWDDMLAQLRSGHKGPYAVYLGSPENRLPRLIAAGAINTAKVPLVIISATSTVQNPMTNQPVTGDKLNSFFAANAGTMLFLDADGLPIPQLSIPQAMHGDDSDLFNVYFSFVAAQHYREMSIADYCRAMGKEGVITRAIARIKNGFSGRSLKPGETLVTGRNHLTGEVVDPWKEGGVFHIYSTTGNGRVFLAQIAEICNSFGTLNPRITLIVPTGVQPDLTKMPKGVQLVLAHAPKDQIQAQGPSPMMVFTAVTDQGPQGMRLHGFQPADVLSKLLGLPLADLSRVNRDIPYAEGDEMADGDPMPGDTALQASTTAPMADPAPAGPAGSASTDGPGIMGAAK